MKRMGRPPKNQNEIAGKRIIFRLSEALWKNLNQEAKEDQRTLSNMLVKILSERYKER
jgi:predicted DNA-binding ribbon-helix-helix protein